MYRLNDVSSGFIYYDNTRYDAEYKKVGEDDRWQLPHAIVTNSLGQFHYMKNGIAASLVCLPVYTLTKTILF